MNVSRHVLTDCIRLLAWILDHLGAAEQDFFGSHMNDCRALLDQSRTETQRAVLARLSKHRKRYERLMQSLDDEVAAATVEALERAAMASGPIGEDIPDFIPAQHECPACKRTGAVYGIASVEADADAEYEDGGEIVYYGYWVVTLEPEFFVCKVCGLRLWGSQELHPAGLPSGAYQPAQDTWATLTRTITWTPRTFETRLCAAPWARPPPDGEASPDGQASPRLPDASAPRCKREPDRWKPPANRIPGGEPGARQAN